MTVNFPIVAGYWFSAVALALFSWRAWYIFRREKEHVFRYIAEGTALITAAGFLYGSAHFPASQKVLTSEFFAADTALVFGIFLACQFPAYYWGRVAGHKTATLVAQTALLIACVSVTGGNLGQLLLGTRPLVELTANGTLHDGAPAWFNYAKVILLIGLGIGAGLTFLYQGIIDQALRQQRLGLGIFIGACSGALLTLVNEATLDYIGIGLLALGVALIIIGLFTPTEPAALSVPAE